MKIYKFVAYESMTCYFFLIKTDNVEWWNFSIQYKYLQIILWKIQAIRSAFQ